MRHKFLNSNKKKRKQKNKPQKKFRENAYLFSQKLGSCVLSTVLYTSSSVQNKDTKQTF